MLSPREAFKDPGISETNKTTCSAVNPFTFVGPILPDLGTGDTFLATNLKEFQRLQLGPQDEGYFMIFQFSNTRVFHKL